MKKLIIIVGFAISCFETIAQEKKPKPDSLKTPKAVLAEADDRAKKFLPQYAPLSPNASISQKFGDYQVNLATGIPDISIPIYSAKSGSLTLPITLRYHTGGFRMSEHASWVGLGWSLDYGVSLNRSVQGLADQLGSGVLGYLDGSNFISQSKNFCTNATDFQYGQFLRDGVIDGEPDLFSYAIPSKSGRFILGQTTPSNVQLPTFIIPYEPIQIPRPTFDANGNIDRAEIIDSDGTQYIFGTNGNREQTTISDARPTRSYFSSYLCSAIKAANSDDAITLSYQSGGTQTTTDRQYSASMIFGAASNTYYSNSTQILPVETAVTNSFTQKNPYKISYENGEIEFIQASGRTDLSNSFTLQSILIKNLENGVLSVTRTIDFVYSTFKDRTGGDARLKLTELRIKDATGVEIETYKFDYWTDSFSWKDGTIDYAKKDFFGFYNGQNNAHLLTLGSYNGIPVVGGAANRLTSSMYMKEGVLKQISYPTGGFTVFDYETNRYKHNGTEYLAGGLRVKEIKSYTNPSTLEFMKRYEYGSEDGAGIGKVTNLNWLPETRIVTTDLRHFSFDPIETSTASQASFAQKDYGEGSYDATPVYYTNVKEYFEEMSTNGSNEYIFSFVPDVISSVVQSTNKEVKQWKRGLLLEQFTRNAQGDVVSHTTNVYQNLKEDSRLATATVGSLTIYEGDVPRSTQSCSTGFIDNGSLGGTAELSYSAYSYYTGSSKVSQIVSVIDGVSTSKSTEYDNNLFVKKTETLESSLNKKYIQESIYPTDPSYDTDTEVLEMRSRNILNVPLESIEKEDNNGSINTLYQQKSVYERFTGTNARGLSQNVLLKEIWVAPKGGTLEKRVIFTDYASNGNPLGYVVDDMPISLVWGYNDALLLAEVKNATKSELDAALSTAGITATGMSSTELSAGQLSQIQNLRNALPNAHVSWYSFRPQVGLSGIVSPDGIVNRFAYDKLNRLRSIKNNSNYLTDLYNYVYATTAPIGCTNPDAPTIAISSSTLCDATLTASGCSGTINWSNGGAGGSIIVSTKTTTTYTATCTVSGCSSSASNALSVPVLPSGWIRADIGTASGCTQNNSGALTLQGSGNVGGSDDSFHWIYKSMSGDFTMIVKINSLPVVNGQRSGIMIRSNTNSNAQFYTLIQDGNENVGELKRDTNGGTGGLYSFAGSAANQTWIKVVKTGTSIKGYHSTNSNPEANNAWNDYFNLTGNAPTTLDFGSNYLIGLVTYGSSNQTTFTNITLNGNAF